MIQVATEVIAHDEINDGKTPIKISISITIVTFSKKGKATAIVNNFNELLSNFPKAVLVSNERLQALEAVYKLTDDYMAVKELWETNTKENS